VVVATTERLFFEELQRTVGATGLVLPVAPTRGRIESDAVRFAALARNAEVVIIGLQTGEYRALIDRVRRAGKGPRLIVVSFGSPYLVPSLSGIDAYVCAFGWRDDSERAAASVLTGARPATGRLPVSLPGAKLGSAASAGGPARATR
jgi:beta-N-acetylhexosaminidase